jgi:hypothetical protein
MEKGTTLENKDQVYDFLKKMNIEYKVYEHASAKTVQDIIGKLFN